MPETPQSIINLIQPQNIRVRPARKARRWVFQGRREAARRSSVSSSNVRARACVCAWVSRPTKTSEETQGETTTRSVREVFFFFTASLSV